MTDLNRYLLNEGAHDSKNRLMAIFIAVSMIFCFAYTIIFATMAAFQPAWVQMTAGVLFIAAFYLLRHNKGTAAKILATITSFVVTFIQIFFYFGNAYGFSYMLIAHIVVVVMIFNYNKPHANILLAVYLLVAVSTFLVAERLETGMIYDYVNSSLKDWFFYSTTIGTIVALFVIMYYFSREIDHAKENLFVMSLSDDLTNLYNRRVFMEYGNRLFDSYDKAEFSLLLLDIDYFKTINDTYGHDNGDKVLIQLAELFTRHMRMYDLVSRYGGEEFAIILPRTSHLEAASIAHRILESVETTPFQLDETKSVHITLSIGIADRNMAAKDFSSMISRADEALYHAKGTGRNRVVVYSKV